MQGRESVFHEMIKLTKQKVKGFLCALTLRDVEYLRIDRERFPRRIQQNGKIPFAFEDSAIPVKSTMHAHVAGLLVRKPFVTARGDHFRVLVLHPAPFREALDTDIRPGPANPALLPPPTPKQV